MAQEDRFAPSRRNIGSQLLSQQQQDRRATSSTNSDNLLGGDTQLTDSSLGQAGSGSVLDSGFKARSYTEGQAEEVEAPIVGGGTAESPAAELDRMRAQEQQMRRTQEQFVGTQAQGVETAQPQGQPQAQGPSEQSVETPTPEQEEEEEAEDEDQDEQEELNAQRAQDLQRVRVQQQRDQAATQQQAVAAADAKKRTQKQILDYLKMSNGALSLETLAVTLLINLGIMNASVFFKYVLGRDELPQTSAEDFCTVACDIAMCPSMILGPPCYLGPLIAILGAIALLSGLLH